jgi:tRNA(Ile)-lysidine synthase
MILQTVKKFLQEKAPLNKPLLLGFSGGADSLALFHSLVELSKIFPCHFHAAHIDHGWRQESGKEAFALEKYVTGFGVPFHLKTLKQCQGEEHARNERLSFFAFLYRQLDCRALLLGHHGDDQSETVLKRILEGAHLTSLGGILEDSCYEGMPIWRPLLKHRKKEIYAWLKEKSLAPLEDPTNQDPRFLRSRMRREILPWLAKKFGKEISGNLCKIGSSTQELKNYLEKQIQPYYKLIEKKEGNIRIDFNSLDPFEPVEIKTFLKKLTDEENIVLSYEALTTLYDLIKRGASKKKILSGKKIIEIHRRVVAIKNVEGY